MKTHGGKSRTRLNFPCLKFQTNYFAVSGLRLFDPQDDTQYAGDGANNALQGTKFITTRTAKHQKKVKNGPIAQNTTIHYIIDNQK